MDAFICTACGTQYAPSETPPAQCRICEEERQYVPPSGQSWTTLKSLAAGRFNAYRQHEPTVIGIGSQPSLRDRPARAADPHAERQRAVGLHLAASTTRP